MFNDVLFNGVIPKNMREYITDIMANNTPDIFIDVNCGTFAVAECAVRAGVKKIRCSDIGLYASVIGYYLSNKNISDLKIKTQFNSTTISGILFDYWISKLKNKTHYDRYLYKNILSERSKYEDNIMYDLLEMKKIFDTVDFEYFVQDMFEAIDVTESIDNSILFIDPPGSKKNDYVTEIDWYYASLPQPDIKSSEHKYIELLNSERNVIIRRFRTVLENEEKYKKYTEYNKGVSDNILANINSKTSLFRKNIKTKLKISDGNFQIFNENDRITEDSDCYLLVIKKDVAFYYRDLFNKGMGTTDAEQFFGFFIDGKLVGVSGFFLKDWIIRNDPYISEVFGFSIRTKTYPRMNKLHMMILTSIETSSFIKSINNTVNEKPRLFKTVCLTKFHEQKGNRGILKLVERTEMKNGLFHLKYETEFHHDTWNQRKNNFLTKEGYDVRTGEKIST